MSYYFSYQCLNMFANTVEGSVYSTTGLICSQHHCPHCPLLFTNGYFWIFTSVKENKNKNEFIPLVHTWCRKLCKQAEVSKIRQHSYALEKQGKHKEITKHERDKN